VLQNTFPYPVIRQFVRIVRQAVAVNKTVNKQALLADKDAQGAHLEALLENRRQKAHAGQQAAPEIDFLRANPPAQHDAGK